MAGGGVSSFELLNLNDNETNGTTPPPNDTHVVQICKSILLQQIGNKSIRVWDLTILIPNVLFMVFLLYKIRRIREKLLLTRSPVFKVFYLLVYIITGVNILRCVVSMSISVTNTFGDIADKILWLVLKFFMLSAELCVLTFGLLFGHLDSRTSIRRVIIATLGVSLLFSTIQSLLEFKVSDSHYRHKEGESTLQIDLFAHGGMLFCMVTSAMFAVLYISVCILPLTRFSRFFPLPRKKRFYIYCGFLAANYCLQVIGAAMIFKNNLYGMCLLDLTTYIYFAMFTPIVYFTFLRGYISSTQPGLLFSYRPQKDEAGLPGEMPDSSSGRYYQPGLPGITSPSFDDILYHPDFQDSTDLNSPNPLYTYDDAWNYHDVGFGGNLILGPGGGGPNTSNSQNPSQQNQRNMIA